MNYVQNIKNAMTKPDDFFGNDIKKIKGLSSSFKLFAVLTLFFYAMSALALIFIGFVLTNVFGSDMLSSFFPSELIEMPISYVMGLGLVFVGAGLIHLWVKLFGGKANYEKTFQVMIYSYAPYYMLGWIPFVNFVISIYSLILLIIGVSHVHKISKLKSTLIFVIPTVLIFAIIIFLAAMLFLYGIY